MKTITLVLLASATSSSLAASLQIRQGPLSLPQQKTARIAQIASQIPRPGSKRMTLKYGPYKLKAANSTVSIGNGISMDPAGTAWNYLAASDFPRDITLLATITKVVFEDDTLADIAQGVYNHHLTFADMNKLPPVIVSCNRNATKAPDAYPISTFMGGSNDKGGALYTTADGKLNSGYYIGKDDKILILGDLVNYKNVAQDVYTLSEIEYVEGRGSNVMEASVQVLDVGFCEGASGIIEPPKGQTKFQVIGKEMTITKDGYWLTSKGHLHDGGVNLLFKVNGKEICNSRALYGGTNKDTWQTIEHMEECQGPIKLIKGDKISLEAYYDLDLHPPRKQHGGSMAEDMALLAGSFAMTNDGK